MPLEQLAALAAYLDDRQEEMLGRDVLVAQPAGLLLGQLEGALGARVEAQRAALDPGSAAEDAGQLVAERGQVDPHPAKRLSRDAVVGLDERMKEVLGIEHRAVHALGGLLRGGDGLLGFLCISIELHQGLSSLVVRVSVGLVGRRARGTSGPPVPPADRGPRAARPGPSRACPRSPHRGDGACPGP